MVLTLLEEVHLSFVFLAVNKPITNELQNLSFFNNWTSISYLKQYNCFQKSDFGIK